MLQGLLHTEYAKGAMSMTAYSRNPAILDIMDRNLQNTYPLNNDESTKAIALSMPHSVDVADVTYHLGRYGEEGLYGSNDPARRHFRMSKLPFFQQYPQLSSKSNALVIAGNISGACEDSI